MILKYAQSVHFGLMWAGCAYVTIAPLDRIVYLCGWVMLNLLAMLVWGGFDGLLGKCDRLT